MNLINRKQATCEKLSICVCVCCDQIIRVGEQRFPGGSGVFRRGLGRIGGRRRRGLLAPCGELAVEEVSYRRRSPETEKAAEAERLRPDQLVQLGCLRQGRFERRLSEEEK